MHKNGFIFVETIVAIVILTGSLLFIYSSFSNILQKEKTRVYYDDASYIYRTYYLKNKLNELNITSPLRDLTTNEGKFFITIGTEYQDLFLGHDDDKNFFTHLLNDFEVREMLIVKENKLDNLKNCTESCSLDKNCPDYNNCNSLYLNTSEELLAYLKTIYVDIPATYILVVEYNTCAIDNTNCHRYYSWVSV